MVTAHPLPEGFTEIEVFAIGTALLVEALLGFCLNGLTIISFRKIKELRTPSNLLVLSIALADCGICINAFIAAFSSFLRYWPYGSDGCQIHGFHGFLSALASIGSSAAVAWDRYHHYCTRSRLQWSTAASMMVFAWLFAAFWSVMPLLGWGQYDYEPLRTCCTLDYSKGDRNYVTFLFALSTFNFMIPGFIMMTAYQSIHQKFRKTGNFKFNTGLPLKTLVICWGPYCLLCSYAAVENVMFIPAKYRMVMEKKFTGRSFQARWLYCDQGAVLEQQSCNLHWFLTSQAGLSCHCHGGKNADEELANYCLQQSKITA